MTHAEAIAVLLALGSTSRSPSRADRDATIAHVADCADCWRTLAAMHREATGEDVAEQAQMAARFGCDDVVDLLFLLVDLDPAAIAREHRGVARHLGWCHSCRTRLAELVAVEREHAAVPRWHEAAARVREAVGRLVVRVGRAAATLVEVPDAFVLGPAAMPVPVRGGATSAEPVVQSARFALDDTGVAGEIAFEPGDGADAAFSLRLTSDVAEPLSLHVRELRADGDALVARYTLRGGEPIAVRGLWPGSFWIELHGTRDGNVHRVRLDVGASV